MTASEQPPQPTVRGGRKIAEQAERYARYCELRDSGTNAIDVWREIGISDGTGGGYERAWRDARGLPRRSPGDPEGRPQSAGLEILR